MYYETIQIDFNSDEANLYPAEKSDYLGMPLPEFRKEILYLR